MEVEEKREPWLSPRACHSDGSAEWKGSAAGAEAGAEHGALTQDLENELVLLLRAR